MDSIYVLKINQFTRVFTSFEKAEEYLKGSFKHVEKTYSPAAPWIVEYKIELIPKDLDQKILNCKLNCKIVRFDAVDFDPKPNSDLGYCNIDVFESVESSL